jgi:hypothetical protein
MNFRDVQPLKKEKKTEGNAAPWQREKKKKKTRKIEKRLARK